MADFCFLGKPHIPGLEGDRAPTEPEEWKHVAVLAYLCLNLPLRLHTDTELAALLWPTFPEALGQRGVARAAEWLNSGRDEPLVESTRFGEFEANQSAFSMDVWAFRGGIRLGAYGDALTLYEGDLLEGLDLPDAPLFMEWLRQQRVKYGRLASLCAWRAYRCALDEGDQHLAGDLLVRAYECSPEPLAILSRVMEQLASVGAAPEALRLFHREPEPPSDAMRVARLLDPSLDQEPPRRNRGWLLGATGLALAVLVSVLAMPDRRPKPEVTPPAEETKREEPVAGDQSSDLAHDPTPDPVNDRLNGQLTPPAIWELATRQLHRGRFEQAEALFHLLLSDAEYGERALISALAAHTALRSHKPADVPEANLQDAIVDGASLEEVGSEGAGSIGHGVEFPLSPDLSKTAYAKSAIALLALWNGVPEPYAPVREPQASGDRPVPVLARALTALKNHNLTEAYRLVSEGPDSLFKATEGPLPNTQFLGWIAAASGDSVRARQHYTAARQAAEAGVRLRGDDPWAYRALALAELGLGNADFAAAALEAARETSTASEDPQLRYKLVELEAMVAGPTSATGAELIQMLLTSRYPWPLQSWHLEADPRWLPMVSPTSVPIDPGL